GSPPRPPMPRRKCSTLRIGNCTAAAARARFAKRSSASSASAATGHPSSRISRVGNLKHRALRGRVIAIALRGLKFVTRHLPLGLIRALGAATGELGYFALPRYRHRALNNIAVAFPDWSESRRRQTIRKMFRDLGASTFELGWLDNLD